MQEIADGGPIQENYHISEDQAGYSEQDDQGNTIATYTSNAPPTTDNSANLGIKPGSNVSDKGPGQYIKKNQFGILDKGQPGVGIVMTFNDPGLGFVKYAWIQTVSKSSVDKGNPFVDMYSDDNNRPNYLFYYPEPFLQRRTNAEYPPNSGTYYTLRFGDGPVMKENGSWAANLTLIAIDDSGFASAVETVFYSFIHDSGWDIPIVSNAPQWYDGTPQLTQYLINEYNRTNLLNSLLNSN